MYFLFNINSTKHISFFQSVALENGNEMNPKMRTLSDADASTGHFNNDSNDALDPNASTLFAVNSPIEV